jgi:subtilisin family serine protease
VRRRLLIVLAVALCASGTAAAATGRISDDPLVAQEWYLADVGATQATPPGPGVPITIVDSGVDASQPEFSGRPNTTFLNDQTVFGREEFHGTAVASVAAAPANGAGMVGIYPTAALQSYDASPVSNIITFVAAAGIADAAQHCPGVINLSFGSLDNDPSLADAVALAVHNGCLVVAASGNSGESGNPTTYPADYPHVLTVGASDEQDQVTSFSTAGPAIDLVAPGNNILVAVPLSRNPAGYEVDSGTSFSAPIVTAAAAWVWTMRPTLDVGQLFQVMRRSAHDIGAPGRDNQSGFGLLNIPSALTYPTPAKDPYEPNEDVDQVRPGQLFADGQPAITTAARPSIRIAGSLDANEDPRDLYRIWIPAHKVVRVSVAASGNAAARIWGHDTTSLDESLGARRRDLKGQQIRGGAHGSGAYVEVLPTGRATETSYVLSVKASAR